MEALAHLIHFLQLYIFLICLDGEKKKIVENIFIGRISNIGIVCEVNVKKIKIVYTNQTWAKASKINCYHAFII